MEQEHEIHLSDAELAAALYRGSDKAFKSIYIKYWPKLLAIAFAKLRDKAVAEEITQDIFLRLWERADELIIDHLESYLAKAVRFSVYKHLLREKRKQEILEQNYLFETIQNDEKIIETRFLEEYIHGVIEKLPPQCKLVFSYSRHDGMSINEIALKLKISPKTVEGHLTKALKTIKKALNSLTFFCISLFGWIASLIFFHQEQG